MDDLEGRVALVTGGASGIGAATAERLASEGCRVVVADVQRDLGTAHAERIGGRYVELDVADPIAWDAIVAEVLTAEGALDVVHCNAGVTTGQGDLLELTDEQYRRIVGVNIDGVVFGTRAAARAMRERGGAIVATASVAGLIGFAPDTIYTLTKHAVVGFVRAAAQQLAAHRITINGICPGIVDTPLVGAEAKTVLEAAGFPLIPPSTIAGAVVTALTSGQTGQCWVCLPGREASIHDFAALPAPLSG